MSYLSGWKRKLGVVLLMLACLFTAAWIRSLRHFDVVIFPAVPSFSGNPASGTLFSWNRGLVWLPQVRARGLHEPFVPHWKSWDLSSPAVPGIKTELEWLLDSPDMHWKLRIPGLGYGELVDPFNPPPSPSQWYYVMSYWWLVLPSTSIAAYLLLSKSRSSTQRSTNIEGRPE